MTYLSLFSCFLLLCLSQDIPLGLGSQPPIDYGSPSSPPVLFVTPPPTDFATLAPLSGSGTQEVGCYRSGERCIYTVVVKLYDTFLNLISETRLECNTTCSSDGAYVFNESCPVCQESIISDSGSILVTQNCLEFTSCVDEPRTNCTAELISNYPPAPTVPPTNRPTSIPTATAPTLSPTVLTTLSPTAIPTLSPTGVPVLLPTFTPTLSPTNVPTAIPTVPPTLSPTNVPTATPTVPPTSIPTATPTALPTNVPTAIPTVPPTLSPTRVPTATPTVFPTGVPTQASVPTSIPTPYAECESCTFTQGGYNKPLCREEPLVCEDAKSMWRTIRPECLLKACFDSPVSIGVLPGFRATFTTTRAIARFLPASRAPGVLLQNLIDPLATPAGVFAGQLLTATLNTQFYSPGNLAFSYNCTVINNRFHGMPIASLIELSHRVISGQRLQQFTPAMLTSALSVYNEAFNACNASNRACFVCAIDASDVPGDTTPVVVVAAERDDIFYLFLAYFVFLLLFFAIVIATRTRGYRTK